MNERPVIDSGCEKTVTLDVREDIRCGREPFSKIMTTVATLQADQQLLLIAPFEPVPLFRVLEKQGFRHAAHPAQSGAWEVLFTRLPAGQPAGTAPALALNGSCNGAAVGPAEWTELDARGLEPPQPLIKILEALASLPKGAKLRAHTDRRPMHLYSQLDERGFAAETEEQSDGSFLTHIRRG
ncbi:MAG TPA: DUF2249 domain-containing protein [Verrucomicrobiae bacterium]|nr:DUF2249 domain-containing protein [Verrucomicrobiae bacterium]